jgi:DNA mismatch endonuclease (patch repair protein)
MSRIRGKDTQPELMLRRALYALGYRYRLHQKGLPGRPDLVFIGRKKAIWVHGCFWHWHPDESCSIAKIPKSRQEYWRAKFTRNRARDQRTQQELQAKGWSVMAVWECQLRPNVIAKTVELVCGFLDNAPGYSPPSIEGSAGTSSG